ncbi:MAG TPA: twin-arginine translocase subunit TatC [Acidimicrobiales bacterium]|nr:twin-arginine translocase subunit TatC [Acidimicrobiales bacterium]
MTLTEHLGELRRRLIVSVVAVVVGAGVAVVLYEPILHFLLRPLCEVNHGRCTLYVTSPLDPLSLRVKVGAFGGLVLGSPVILWEMWRFVTPGLKASEKRYAIPFVAASVALFAGGAAVAYLTLPHALGFLGTVGGSNLREIYDPISYLSLILLMMTLFGLTFEFPVVLVSLQLARVVSAAKLLGWWRWAVILITLVAAIFTPSSDPFSMLALAVPLTAFYFASILVGKLLGR